MEEKIIEEVLSDGIIGKLSPIGRFKAGFKKVLMFIITLKIILETIRLLGNAIIKAIDLVRRAILISLEEKSWKVILWIKFWRVVYGIIGGVILEYNFGLFTKVLDFFNQLIELI